MHQVIYIMEKVFFFCEGNLYWSEDGLFKWLTCKYITKMQVCLYLFICNIYVCMWHLLVMLESVLFLEKAQVKDNIVLLRYSNTKYNIENWFMSTYYTLRESNVKPWTILKLSESPPFRNHGK